MNRLHPVAMLLEALTNLRRWASAAAIPLVVTFFGNRELGFLVILLFAALIILVLSAIWGFLAWQNTLYWVDQGAFHFRRGVVGKSERSIPLEHIQSVDVVQGIVQRLFGVVEIRIETAGGGGGKQGASDAALPALSRAAANTLQAELATRRRVAVAAPDADADDVPAGPVVIRRLGVGRLLLAGATSGQIGVALPIIGAASQLLDNVFSDERAIGLTRSLFPRSISTLVIVFLAILFLAWLVSIFGAVLAYAGFTLSRDGENLRIRRGLLERREVTIPLKRIQAVRTVEGVLRQPFGLVLLRMDSAGYGGNAGVSTTLFPLLSRHEVQAFLRDATPEFAVSAQLQPLPRRSLRRYIFREVRPLLLLAVPLAAALVLLSENTFLRDRWPYFAAGYALWLIALAGYGWWQFAGAGWALHDDRLVLRVRRLARSTAIIPRRRLQTRSLSQSPFQRRAGLATLGAKIASGSGGSTLSLVDMDAAAAQEVIEQLGPAPRPRSDQVR